MTGLVGMNMMTLEPDKTRDPLWGTAEDCHSRARDSARNLFRHLRCFAATIAALRQANQLWPLGESPNHTPVTRLYRLKATVRSQPGSGPNRRSSDRRGAQITTPNRSPEKMRDMESGQARPIAVNSCNVNDIRPWTENNFLLESCKYSQKSLTGRAGTAGLPSPPPPTRNRPTNVWFPRREGSAR